MPAVSILPVSPFLYSETSLQTCAKLERDNTAPIKAAHLDILILIGPPFERCLINSLAFARQDIKSHIKTGTQNR
jgi:hypothetical protein